MRAAIRLLVALTLLAWGQFGFAVDYYWYWGTTSITTYKTPLAACTGYYAGKGYSSFRVTPVNASKFKCEGLYQGTWYFDAYMMRYGDSCPAGSTYNASTGSCDAPKDCSATAGKKKAVAMSCTYIASSNLYSCPREMSVDGCAYIPSGAKTECQRNVQPDGTHICTAFYTGSGEESSDSATDCTAQTCADAPSPGDTNPDSGCVTAGGNTVCIKDEETGCGTFNGQEGCFKQDEGCGFFNDTWGCFPQDKPLNNCGWANGQQICFDPKDPTKVIDPSSPDHPANGGNADGNQNNDPMAPGGTPGSSPQSGSSGATNQAINDLGEKLGPKIDKTNSLLQQIIDGLFGQDYDNSGDGSDSEAEVKGGNAGDAIGNKIKTEGDRVQQEREEKTQDQLDKVESTVDSWFGGGIDMGNALERIFPSASGCGIFSISFSLGKYSAHMDIDTCVLSRVRALLEWIVWCWTIIGVWKIFYSGLRLEDTKAAKSGY
uniref:hypothetical protein n=1 Tax=Pseudomonas sp. RW407 TaxID=2202894 RepID=UPI0011B5EE57|nr:hypothetical protein [Pseudomonas sp. RW407]